MSGTEQDSIDSMETNGGLAKGREKRITAGNRLQALLDEEYVAESIFDVGDDQDEDFEGDKNPLQDIEISESDEEESEGWSEGAEDREIERAEKKACFGLKIRKRKPPEAFFKARKQSRGPGDGGCSKKPPCKAADAAKPGSVRHSSRIQTIENKILMDHRLREHRKRKSRQGTYAKMREKQMTQEERIAEARITEERNKQLLQKFIDMEKERKKNARSLLKTSKPLTGPFIRFLSKRVNESVDQRLFSAEKDSDQGGHAAMDGKEAIENVHDADNGSSDELSETLRENVAQNNKEALEGDGASADNGGAAMDMATMRENDDESISIHFDDRQSEELSNKEERNPIEDVSGNISRNYIILEGFPEPFDLDKQKNILFSHADPPIEPKKNRCLITGKTARYKDPVSGLYYSDLSAYQTICRIIRGDIPWSPIACTFVAILRPASGVPRNFHDSQPFQGE